MMLYLTGRIVGTAILLCTLGIWNTEAAPLTRVDIKQLVVEEALNSNVPPALALALAKVGSNFNSRAKGTAGEQGVMQVMPKIAEDYFAVWPQELWQPRTNIQIGIGYLHLLYGEHGQDWNQALAHYKPHLHPDKGSQITFDVQTRLYVAMVDRWRKRYATEIRNWHMADKSTWNFKDDEFDTRTPPPIMIAQVRKSASATVCPAHPYPVGVVREVEYRFPNVPHQPSNHLDDDLNSSAFQDRLFKAHQSLDDFAPIIRWTNG